MSTQNIFEKAVRNKLRFDTHRGQLSVEQLWDLPLTSAANVSLDGIAVALDTEIRNTAPKSFISEAGTNAITAVLQLKFDIVKHIIDVRMAENKAKVERQQNDAQRQMLLEAIAAKKNEALLSGDVDELEKKLAALG